MSAASCTPPLELWPGRTSAAGLATDANGQVKTATIATAGAAGTLIGTAATTAAGSLLKLRVEGAAEEGLSRCWRQRHHGPRGTLDQVHTLLGRTPDRWWQRRFPIRRRPASATTRATDAVTSRA
jgi:hypothetical protein